MDINDLSSLRLALKLGDDNLMLSRQQVEEALRESKVLFEGLFESSPDATVLVNEEGQIIRLNKQMEVMFGYSREELLGQTVELLLPTRFHERHVKHRLAYGAEPRIRPMGVDLELYGMRKDGTEFPVEIMLSPLQTDSGPLTISVIRDITDRKQAEEERTRYAAQLQGLAEVSLEINSLFSVDDILEIVIEKARTIIGAHLAVISFTLENCWAQSVMHSSLSDKYAAWRGYEEKPTGSGIYSLVCQTNRPLRLTQAELEAHPAFQGFSESADKHPPLRGWLAAPLIGQDDRNMGLLQLSDKYGGEFTADDEAILVQLAQMASVAIENVRLIEAAERRAEEAETLRQAGAVVVAALRQDQAIQRILEQLERVVPYDSASVQLLDDGYLEIVGGRGWFDPSTVVGLRYPVPGDNPNTVVIEQARPHILNNARTEYPSFQEAWHRHVQSWLGVPLIVQDRVIGMLTLDSSKADDFTPNHARLAAAFADQVAIALENARLFAETQRLLQQTRDQARQVQQIMDTVPEGLLLLDAEHRIVLANPTAWDYLILLTDAAVGERLTHLAEQPLEGLLRPPPDALWHELEVQGPPYRVFEMDAQSMKTGPYAGGWVLVMRDVTSDREFQKRIQQQDRMAAVGQLAAGIAHDFNNILTGIIGFAELAQFEPDDIESSTDAMQLIIKQAERAAHLVRQILDFSRQSIIEMKPLDLGSLLKETHKLLERTLPENIQITLEIESSSDAHMLNADPAQIQQILANLAVNARDAMPDGGNLTFKLARLTVLDTQRSLYPDLSPGNWLTLAVSDTGVGIPAANHSHVFEPFFTTKDVGKGTGLGLAQVYGIVKQHGGEIDLDSELDVGTTFTVYLPALTISESQVSKIPNDVTFSGAGESILVVEDDVTVREVTEALLKSLGYRVLPANDGLQALDLYERHRNEIALVLTDMTMPVMGGIALSRALWQRNPYVKVVAMSGYPLEPESRSMLSHGIVDWLQKPLNRAQLAETINRALKA